MNTTTEPWRDAPKTVNEVAFERLQQLIFTGRVVPGERLDERRLSEVMGMSRTPLRHAISRLASLGVVEYRVYKGHFLISVTSRRANDLFEVRKALEGLAARSAATEASEDQIDALREIVVRAEDAFQREDLVAFETADRAFHEAIAVMSGNEILLAQLEDLALRVQLVRHVANLDADLAMSTEQDRRQVLDAIASHDAGAAETALLRHIQSVQDQVVVSLAALETDQVPTAIV
jgi:DNA-binding GntR family transcriptional regulator